MSETATNEAARLEALRSYAILDTPVEGEFDSVVQLAARLLHAPIALISLIDRDRQWFKASIGLDGVRETPREMAFCDHAIRMPGVMVVPDATADSRFTDNPLVTGAPHIRFYAAAPLIMPGGHALGTLCVIDHEPRLGMTERDRAILAELSGFVRDKLELRRAMARSKAQAAQAALMARIMMAAAEAPDFASAILSAAEAVLEATKGKFCHVWRLGADGRTALFVGGAGHGMFAEEACSAELRAMRLTPEVSRLATALVRDEQNWSENSADTLASEHPAAALAWRGGVRLQLATPFSLGAERYGFSLGLATAPPEREAMALLMREATAALRPVLRRHMDEAQARLFRRLIETSGAGIVVSEPPFDEPGPHIIYANPAFESMTGYALAEIKGRSPRFLFGPGTDPEARRRIGAAIRTGRAAVEEVKNYRKDGTSFWTSLRVTPVPDSSGAVTHFISSQTDITSIRDARLERDALTRDLQALVAAIPGVLMRHRRGEDGRWMRSFIAPGVEGLTGFTVDEAMVVGWWSDNTQQTDRPRLSQALADATEGAQSRTDFHFRRKDGAWIRIRVLLRGHVAADGTPEVIGIWSDASEEYALAAEREARTRDLQTVIATLPGILIRARPDANGNWRRVEVSANVTEVTGYSVEEAMAPNWWNARVEPDVSATALALFSAPFTEATTECDFPFRHKDGRRIWIRRRARGYQDEHGVREIVSIWDDITAQKTLLLERESLTADLQRVIATMPGVLFRANKDREGRWQRHYVSPAVEALTGFTVEEAMDPDWWLPNIHPADQQLLTSTIEQGNAVLPFGLDFRFRHKQGHMIWIHRITSGYLDADGRPEVISIWSDVTAEKRLLMDREELAADLRAVVEATPGVLIRKRRGPDGAWYSVYVGPTIESVTGHTVEEAMAPGWLEENLDPVEAAMLIGQLRDHFSVGQHSIEFRFRHRGGHWIWVRRIARAHLSAGGVPEVIAIWNDVSVEKSLAQRLAQSSKLAQLGEVATGMAHELNQPLAGISLAAENAQRILARMDNPPQRAQDKLSLIVNLTKRASDIIDHMRIFGRSETAGRAPVSVTEAIAGAESLLTSKLQAGEVRLEVSLPEDLPPILGNSVPLEQVLMNLISNACDGYASMPAPPARRVIEISAHAEADWLTIEVQDAAGGIPEDVLPRIFEPFFTTKPVGKGTGLGLSISYGIIADMGGRIVAENRGEGCLMRIMLPVASGGSEVLYQNNIK